MSNPEIRALTLGDICERLGEAGARCGGEFNITLHYGRGETGSYITHWEKTGLYGAERPKNVSIGSLPEVLAGLERYMAEYTRSEEHTSELQSRRDIVCRLLLEK